MDGYQEFEVIDRYGARWRYKRSEGYGWQFAVEDDEQTLNHNMVEVFHADDDELQVVKRFPFAALVGDVTPDTAMNLNLREIEPEWAREREHLETALRECMTFADKLSCNCQDEHSIAYRRWKAETSGSPR